MWVTRLGFVDIRIRCQAVNASNWYMKAKNKTLVITLGVALLVVSCATKGPDSQLHDQKT